MTAVPVARPRREPESGRARPQLTVVAPPRHTARYVLLYAALLAVGVFGIVSLSALAAEQSFAARGLEAEIGELTHRYEELTADVAALESPARVRAVAIEELGMVPAAQPAYLVVDDVLPAVPVAHTEGLADPLKPALGANY